VDLAPQQEAGEARTKLLVAVVRSLAKQTALNRPVIPAPVTSMARRRPTIFVDLGGAKLL